MRLALIGMSGVGKSHWSEALAARGYLCYHCDDLIAERLSQEIGQALSSVHDLGHWMGLPTQPDYRRREAQYLANEAAVLEHILRQLARNGAANLIVDLTGSAIYLAPEQLARLRQFVKVVYLALTPEVRQAMLGAYLQQPRPLIWQDLAPPDDDLATLERHYWQLLAYREKLYENLCDVKLPYHLHRRPGFTVDDFLQCTVGRLKHEK